MSTTTTATTTTGPTTESTSVFPLSRALAFAGIVGPPMILASSVAWMFGADQLRYVVQCTAAPLTGLGLLGLCAVLAQRAPRAAGVLALMAAAGLAIGGAGFAVDGLHEVLLDSPSLADEGGLAGALAPILPGMLGQLAMIGIGIGLLRTRLASPPAAVALIAAGALFAVSRVNEIAGLAAVVDVLIIAAVVPLALRIWQGRPLRDA